MKNYAMVKSNKVIGVLLNQASEPHWPPSPEGILVFAISCDADVQIGMLYDSEKGVFSWPAPEEPIPPKPTQMDRIEEMLNALTADTVTAESISAAISEGVNEV